MKRRPTKIEQDIRPVTWVKNCTREMLDQVNETRRPIIVTQDGKPRAVIQDAQTYEKTQDTLAMLQIVLQGEREFAEGKGIPQDEVFAKLLQRSRRRKTG